MKIDKLYKKTFVIFSVSFLVSAFVFFLFGFSIMKHLELKTVDYRFRKFSDSVKADTSIVIVAIDDNSLEFFGKNNISWPWPRDFYAILVDYLTTNGVKEIIFDIFFNQPDIDREETDAEYTDGLFAASLADKNVILAVKLGDSEKKIEEKKLQKFALKLSNFKPERVYNSGVFPLDIFLKNAKNIGVVNVYPDSDGIIRRVPVLYKFKNIFLPQIGLTPFLESPVGEFKKNKLIVNALKIPVDKKGNYFVNWYKKDNFKFVTFSSVIQSAFAKKYGEEATLPDKVFNGKTVLIGSTASGIDDMINVPFADPIPGVELWATIISNFENNDFIDKLPEFVDFMILFVVVFLTIYFFIKIKSRFIFLFWIFLPVFSVWLNFILFARFRIVYSMTMPITGFIFAFIYSSLSGYFIEGKSRKELKKVFSRYLHPMVIEQILNNPEKIKLGGASIEATVLFSDIADFTPFSENKTAEELIRLLNKYFEVLTDFVLSNKGLLDKYTGDGIMAIFGAPVSMQKHAYFACKAALAHKKFSESDQSEVALLHRNTRIGINSGIIVAGNLGSEQKTDYTAIGDNVNLASRLEGVNKVFRTKIIISESTFNRVKEDFICRELDKIRVKGKNLPTSIYELVDEKTDEKFPRWIKAYEEGLSLYRRKNWDLAKEKFNLVLKLKGEDFPSRLMIERCEKLKKENPENWDGVFSLKTK